MHCRLIQHSGFILIIAVCTSIRPTDSQAQIVVSHSLIGGGGGIHSSSEMTIFSSIGQPLAGFAGAVESGFWATTRSRFVATAADDAAAEIPSIDAIADVYPNPFRGRATIRFGLSAPSPATLSIHDVMGREVARLVDGVRPAGVHMVAFESAHLASGLYFCRLTTNRNVAVRSMTLLR